MSDVSIFWHSKFLKVAAAEEVLQPTVHVVPLTAVPDLTGDTQARAGQVLQAAGLVLGAVTQAPAATTLNLQNRTGAVAHSAGN